MVTIIAFVATIIFFGGFILLLIYMTDRTQHPRPKPQDDQLKRSAMRLLDEIRRGDNNIPVLTTEQRETADRILRSYYGKELGP